jgi:hypothetical protein
VTIQKQFFSQSSLVIFPQFILKNSLFNYFNHQYGATYQNQGIWHHFDEDEFAPENIEGHVQRVESHGCTGDIILLIIWIEL